MLDPGEGVAAALTRRSEWPGAVFNLKMTAAHLGSDPSGAEIESRFIPLEAAFGATTELNRLFAADPYGERSVEAKQILDDYATRRQPAPACRLLHLSDLHLGTKRAAEGVTYLQASVKSRLGNVDRVVITGDLFDQPRRSDLQQYKNFTDTLTLLGAKPAVVVPGNHDQRTFGNSIGFLGRRRRALSELHWAPVTVDDEAKVVFLCFDSAREGDLARGEITRAQLLNVAAEFDVRNASGAFDGYLRVAVVHHHPHPYDTDGERPILDPRSWPGRESLIEMREAERFVTWCAGRRVGLIMHGHRHIPRLVNSSVEIDHQWIDLTTAGCGSSLGAGHAPMSYNVIDWSEVSQTWSVNFQVDRGDGQGFRSAVVQSIRETVLA